MIMKKLYQIDHYQPENWKQLKSRIISRYKTAGKSASKKSNPDADFAIQKVLEDILGWMKEFEYAEEKERNKKNMEYEAYLKEYGRNGVG